MIRLFTFNCEKCGNEIKKINKFTDIFLIKRGKIIECTKCHTQYAVPNMIQKSGSLYHYLFLGGLVAIIWLSLTVLIDNIVGKEISDTIGIWMWLISAIIYLCIEAIVALVLPLKEKFHDEL